MYYEEKSCATADLKNVLLVDMRSDTLTKPTKKMREAMFYAEVGDDVYQEDPTVKRLQDYAAKLLGTEDAIFVSSGTMGNLIAIMIHCDVRGCEAYCGSSSHVMLHEQGGASQIGGVTLCPLRNNSDGTFDLAELRTKLRHDYDHEPMSKLVIVENTINGKIVPEAWLMGVVEFAKKHGLKLHMDGARLFNASVGSSRSVRDIVRGFDSVTFCLSKGLGAPVGSILCGNKEFVAKARRARKVLGGGMRQVGILAAAGLVALQDTLEILPNDHANARKLASSINSYGSKVFRVDPETVQTNMIFLNVNSKNFTAVDFAQRLRQTRGESDRTVVKCLALSDTAIRFVLHYDITENMLLEAIKKITKVMKEFDSDI